MEFVNQLTILSKGNPSKKSWKSVESAVAREVAATTIKDEQLLRGILSRGVLGCFGQILQNAEGSADTYRLSQPVATLDSFVSHNWSVNRWSKFMVLAMHFNFNQALLAMIFVGVAFFVWIYLANMPWSPVLCLGSLCFFFVFNIMFLFASHIPCCPGHRTFLDKACIHQTDTELMREGIQSLAAFLTRSKSMVIVLGPEYLTKVWTVYELATFLIVNPRAKLFVYPLFLPVLVISCNAAMCLLSMVYTLNKDFKFMGFGGTRPLLASLFVIFSFISRRWARTRQYFRQEIKNFDLRSSKCFQESDRELVIANVEAFMVSRGLAKQLDDPVADFNAMVQVTLPTVIDNSLGKYGIRYSTAFAICCPFLFIQLPYIWANHNKSEELPYRIIGIVGSAALGIPNGLALIYFLNTRATLCAFNWLPHCMNIAIDLLYTFLVSVAGGAFALTAPPVWKNDESFWQGSVLGVAYLVHLAVAPCIYGSRVCQHAQMMKQFQNGLKEALGGDVVMASQNTCNDVVLAVQSGEFAEEEDASLATQTRPAGLETQAHVDVPPLSALPRRFSL